MRELVSASTIDHPTLLIPKTKPLTYLLFSSPLQTSLILSYIPNYNLKRENLTSFIQILGYIMKFVFDDIIMRIFSLLGVLFFFK